ncbi:hypothetical protein F3644_04160 [Escherichia coli]|nr:hypothetical protein [Escherichia coli]
MVFLSHVKVPLFKKTLFLCSISFPYEAMEQHAICLVKCATVRISQNSHEVNLSVESTKTNSASSRTEGKGKEKTKSAVPDDLINSFYIHEMEALEGHWIKKNVGRGFFDYMTSVSRENRQVTDVRTGEGLDAAFDRLRPTQPPVGTWPSLYPLAFSQQLAVNELWRKNAETPGIFAVNGPPGTGKTTLLRDVVAAVVTARAGKPVFSSTSSPSVLIQATSAASSSRCKRTASASIHCIICRVS